MGITASRATLKGPLSPRHQRRLEVPEHGVWDYEWVESYRLDGWAGGVRFNEAEVSEVRFVSLEEVRRGMAAAPQDYTQWFREELAHLGHLLEQ